MKIIKDVRQTGSEIQSCLQQYGHLPQHHYDFYLNYTQPGAKNIFFSFGHQEGILGYCKNNIWRILTEPVALPEKKIFILLEVIDWIFKKSQTKKIVLEDMTEDFRKEILQAIKNSHWRAIQPSDILFWPVFNLKDWDEKLSGKQWKRLRNIRNRFFQEHQVEIKIAWQVNKEDLKKVVYQWLNQRRAKDRVHYRPYLRFIDNDFQGCQINRIILVDGQIVSITAGWQIPNSQSYYSAIGLNSYDCPYIGEIANLDDLTELKKRGYYQVDFGGSDKSLLAFKMKFHPQTIYKTYTFSLVRK